MAIERPVLPSMAHHAEFTDLPDEPRSWSAEGALASLLALVPLDDLPRTGWILRGIEAPESIAGHVVGVAHVALAIAPQVRPALDLGRVLAMALVHDAPEAVSGDLPLPAARHLPAGAKKTMEAGIARDLLGALSTAAVDAYAEYIDQGTREARFAKQCDRIQLGVRLLAYEQAGRQGLDEFWRGLEGDPQPEFPAAEAVLDALRAARPLG